jgi:hypothetical protein
MLSQSIGNGSTISLAQSLNSEHVESPASPIEGETIFERRNCIEIGVAY